MTANEIAALAAVAEMTKPRGPTAPQVAERIGVTRNGARKIAHRLIKAGLLKEHRREANLACLEVTIKGHAALEAEKGDA